jgi:hypothetical protein
MDINAYEWMIINGSLAMGVFYNSGYDYNISPT